LYLLMMAEAFLGYILPWHQMSYWAATVLTSILNSIPLVGGYLYKFVVGGFSVTNVTLVRVFSAHVCLAFVILGLSVVHLFYLHKSGSKNPLFVSGGYGDVVLFHSFFTNKDGFVLMVLLFLVCGFLLCCPDLVLDVERYIQADPLVTPVSIKPDYSLGRQLIFWFGVSNFILLSYLGACHPEVPFIRIILFLYVGSLIVLFGFFMSLTRLLKCLIVVEKFKVLLLLFCLLSQ
uniref:Cytochrome b n=1 Tax=Echinostoma caproni TaxID=27848 RepID=A0A183B4I8_9TREM